MRFVISLIIVLFIADFAEARIFGRRRGRSYTTTTGFNTSLHGVKVIDEYTQGIAQYRANEMARMNRWGHFWAGFGNGWAEGVGSGMTPEAACSSCCDFNGKIIGQAVAQSSSGRWFACTIYGN